MASTQKVTPVGGKRRKRKALPALPSARSFGLASASPSPVDDPRGSSSPQTPSLPITPVSEVSPTLLGATDSNNEDQTDGSESLDRAPVSEVEPTLLGLGEKSAESLDKHTISSDLSVLNKRADGQVSSSTDTHDRTNSAESEVQDSLATPEGWKKSVAGEEDTRKNILSWLSKRRVEQALKRSAALSSGEALPGGNRNTSGSGSGHSESRSAMTTAQFQRRLVQVASETHNPSYLHVKQVLVAEFGSTVFQENRDDVRMHLKALAHLQSTPSADTLQHDDTPSQGGNDATGLHETAGYVSTGSNSQVAADSALDCSSRVIQSVNAGSNTDGKRDESAALKAASDSDFSDLDELLTFAQIWCNKVLKAGEMVTYLRLKISMSEHFGRMAIEMNKTRIQNFIRKYGAWWKNEHTGSAAHEDSAQITAEKNTQLQADAERLARRMQLRADMQAKLQGMQTDTSTVGHGTEEERLMFDQLAELDLDIVQLSERVNPSGPHAGKYGFLFLPNHIVSNILRMLPTQCFLYVIPRVCTRFRNLVKQGENCHLALSWSRRFLSDRALAKHALPAVSSVQSLSLVSCTRLTDDSCHVIAKTQSATLQHVDLSFCHRVTDVGLRALAACHALQDVRLRECAGITTSGVRALTSKLHLLRRLDLGQVERKTYDVVTADTVDALGSNCTHLRALHLGRCGAGVSAALATGTLLASIGANLHVLDIRGCAVFDDVIRQVARHAPRLRRFYTSGNPQVSASALGELVAACPDLRALDMGGVPGVEDAFLAEFLPAKVLPLEELSLSRCTRMTDAGLGSVAVHFSQLRYANISFSDQITNAGVQAVAQASPQLLAFDLSCCFLVTSPGIQAIAEHCRQLQRLVVRGCTAVQDSALQAIASQCKYLQSLDVSNCVKLGDVGLGAIVDGCVHLSDLRMGACRNATDVLAAIIIGKSESKQTELHRVDCGGSGISVAKQREMEVAIANNPRRLETRDSYTF